MTIRTALVACAVALATLAAATAAYAGDPYGGFGPSESAPKVPDSGSAQGGGTADVYQTLPWLQQPSQSQPENYGGEWYQQRAVQDDGSAIDDASGH